MVELKIDPRRCLMPDCGGWAVHDGSNLCISHSPAGQAKQRAGNELRRKALSLPKLNSTAAARKWLALVGQAVSQGQLKLSVAKELRLTASAYLASDRDGALADRLSELEQRLRDGESQTEAEA